MTVAYPQSSRNGLAGVIQTRCNAGAGGPRLYLAEAGGALPSTGILGFVELADFGAPADGVTLSASNGNIGSATAGGTIAEAIYADSDGNEVHRTDDVGVGPGFEVSLDRLDVLAGDRIKLLADVSYTSSLTSPQQVGGLVAYWEGPAATGEGTTEFEVPDLSGNENHATQAATGRQPLVTGGALDFSAGGDFLDLEAVRAIVANATRVALILQIEEMAPQTNAGTTFAAGTDATTDDRYLLAFTGGAASLTGPFGSVANVAVAMAALADNNVHPLTIQLEDDDLRFLLDGAQVAQHTLAAPRWPDLASFTFSVGNSSFCFKGRLRRMFLVVGRIPTSRERSLLESWNPLAGSPLAVAGLKVWHDAAHVAGAGTAGYQVTDRTGRGHHGTQATVSFQPEVVGGELRFTPADHYDIATATLGLGGASKAVFVFRVRAAVAVPAQTRKLLADAAETSTNFALNVDSGAWTFAFPNISNRLVVTAAELNATTARVLTIIFNSGTISARVDGAFLKQNTVPNTTIPALGTPELTVGGWNFQWDGDVSAFLLVTGRIPSEAELQILESAAAAAA